MDRGAGAQAAPNASERLLPYVPRLVAEWATERAGERWQPVRGTMVFADLSGFTAMSERLARLGRQGAEEVTDAIGSCFEQLLTVAYDAGGGLLKFGGDALLLAFTGTDHRRRAVWSAAAMRERLRTVGRLKTPAGNVTLRMSVGVHSGTFDCFLVGAPTRELLVSGAAASEVVAMEHDATAGQIVLSAATATGLPPEWIGEPVGHGFLLKGAPDRPAMHLAEFPHAAEAVDLREFLAPAVHGHVLAGGGTPEHRIVTVGFVHFDDIDRRIATAGAPATSLELEELVSTVAAACADHGVALLATDVDGDGGKFVLAAGAPSVLGHDEARMLATARRIATADIAIPVRVGVHRGPVFAGDVGPRYRRTYTVMGDTVNLAARLMAAASAGEVFATSDVLERAPGFEATALPPMKLKGKRAPVHAFSVGAATAGLGRDKLSSVLDLPFVGRTKELDWLLGSVAGARAGRGVHLQILGPAGIGKSRLLLQVREEAGDVGFVRIACEAYEAATPYATAARLLRAALSFPPNDEVSVETLRAAVRERAPHLAPWLPVLGPVLDIDIADTPETSNLAPQFRPARTATTAAELLASALAGPTIVAVDDAEWIDEASREIVEVFSGLVEDARVVLVLLERDDAIPIDDARAVWLGPLDPTDVEHALVLATEHAPLRPHELAMLTERAGGNPLFLTELWRAAAAGESADDLPDSVEALVTAQIDRLAPTLRTVLGYGAVLGRTFARAELSNLVRNDAPLDAATWRALDEFIVLDGECAQFRHGLLRDAAYGKLPFRRRRQLHERAARAIEVRLGSDRDSEAELLSLHFFYAHAFDEAWHYARRAGDRARAMYANIDAAVLYERALDAARRLPDLAAADVAATRESLGDVHDRNGEYERALADFRAARRLIRGDVVREAELLLKEAWIPERIGRYSDAVRTIRKGMRLVEELDHPDALRVGAKLGAWYAAVRQGQGRSREAIRAAARAAADAAAAGDLESEAYARYILDWAAIELGAHEQAINLPRALALYEELGDLSGQGLVLNLQGTGAYYRGQWNEAIECYERAFDAYTRAGSAVDAARARGNIAEVRADQGHLDEADAMIVDALRVTRAAGYRYEIAWATSLRGRIAARAGRFDDAETLLAEARDAFARAGLPGEVARTDALVAELQVLRGRAHAAVDLVAQLLAHPGSADSPEAPLLHRIRGLALMQTGDVNGAQAAFAASLASARERGADYEIALTSAALAETPDAAQDTSYAASRDELFARLGIVTEAST